ncbi:MAG: flagellar basal body-associated FliL family protein [Rickettsiaceae bacterium]|nr:flagellar basal body-associated FliL family protein [Rickettsiaceae bacterium]
MAEEEKEEEKETKDAKKPDSPTQKSEEVGEEEQKAAPKAFDLKGKRFLIIMIVAALVLLVAAICAVYFFFDQKKNENGGEYKEISKPHDAKAEFYYAEINNIMVKIASDNPRKNFLKISLFIQVKTIKDLDAVNAKLYIITDSFQVFLRELRPSDLSGTAGVLMLKTELLKRVNKIIEPTNAIDVLFKEILMS